jgi:hypothetical protein
MILSLFVSVSVGCSLCRDYCIDHPEIRYMPAATDCLPDPPPREWPVEATVDATCPANFALCLQVDAGLSLEHNLLALRRYSTEAWARCGASVPDAGAGDAGVAGAVDAGRLDAGSGAR